MCSRYFLYFLCCVTSSIFLTQLLRNFFIVLATSFALTSPLAAFATGHSKKHVVQQIRTLPFGPQAEMAQLANAISQNQELPAAWVRRHLSHARRVQGLEKLVMPPPTSSPKNWAAYQARFIEPRRIQAGVQFWQTHREALERAQNTYGVPAELVVGVIGVETFYGQHMGKYKVLDVLTTLALHFPPEHPRAQERQAFFKSELGYFLKMVHAQPKGQPTITGSYAGAMGWPQFMPSSWSRFAVDFDGDGRIDLLKNPVDAIGSVANYFKAFGWQTGMPTHYPVRFDESKLDKSTLLAPDILPSFSADSMRDKGVLLEAEAQQHKGNLALVELFNGTDAPSYVVGTENFYVVTRYNWSSYYALAVIELGAAIASEINNAR
ncbi:MAG: lytic murein transglycosylase B [Burkholderiales bacterium]|nr:lytic murein transglycosylase B [Burkholderiales bacterium]